MLASNLCYAQKTLSTKEVSVFKNGTGFIIKEGTVSLDTKGNFFYKEHIPQAAFGTLWFSSPSANIKSISTHVDSSLKVNKYETTHSSSDFKQMLQANINNDIVLHLNNQDVVSGELKRMQQDFLIVKTDQSWINLNISSVQRIEFKSQPSFPDRTKSHVDTIWHEEKGLQLNFNQKSSTHNLSLMYLQNGIGWLPSYHIELINDNKAKLSMRAAVFNDAEDLYNTKLNFVVGVPNFAYQHQTSPLVSDQQFNQFMSMHGRTAPTMQDFANRGGNVYGVALNRTGAASGEQGGIQGSATEDLFFYTLPEVSLKKGDRAFYSILNAEIPIKHIYEVQLNASEALSVFRNNPRSGFSFEENFKNKVWHTLKITNNTSTPFTSGAVMVTKNDQSTQRPVSQDDITYTPAGADAFLRLTVAPDVSVRDKEKVIERVQQEEKIDGYYYDKVLIEGEIKIHNRKSKSIDLNVRKRITGKLASSKPNWEVLPLLAQKAQQNEIQDVCWEMKLGKGEQRTVKYTYTLMVRR